ncbi:MAG: hypothetical protein HQ568_07565 [Calditrichaeota bacterium]|nr:hypothetical protein [Calditrichota bacterium]
MLPSEAKKIIESLANGVCPVTGEVLPDDSPYNSPQVIRALFAAVNAFDFQVRREERRKKLPNNAGKQWTTEEDQELISAFNDGNEVKEIAKIHERTRGAIASRLVVLGQISDRYAAYANKR